MREDSCNFSLSITNTVVFSKQRTQDPRVGELLLKIASLARENNSLATILAGGGDRFVRGGGFGKDLEVIPRDIALERRTSWNADENTFAASEPVCTRDDRSSCKWLRVA